MNGKAFAVRGEFRGFIVNEEGKRRAVLRIDEHEVAFKLPRELRRVYEDHLAVGQMLDVEGRERTDEFTGRIKRVIERLRVISDGPPSQACAGCTIQVCTKKNCWHSGGRALWHFLEEQIAASGLQDTIRLKSVRCLDHCKHAPVIAIGKKTYVDCDRETVARLVEGFIAK